MEEEDDSGYEARSTVTTSNSIYQTDLQQSVYYNNLNRSSTNSLLNYSRPATTVTNYSSNYSSNSLIISTSSNELRSPQNSGSRPQSSAYSTISSCSLNRIYQPTIFEQQQQYPRLEEYQPLDQFRLLERVSDNQFNNQPFNDRQFDSEQRQQNMSTNRPLNSSHQRTSSPDYEQDWSAGEQDEDSDDVVDHVRRPVLGRQIELSPENLNRRFRYLEEGDFEQNDNDVEEYNEKDNRQLVNILNSPLDCSPFSSPLSLPSSGLSNSNESDHNSSNSSPTTCLTRHALTKQQQTKLKLPADYSAASSTSLESPKSFNSLHSPHSLDLPSSPKQVNATCSPLRNESHEPISEEEFTSRKTALRERINNTFRILNNINNNCNRFRTITSRSQELINQRRQAELEIENIVNKQTTNSSIGSDVQEKLTSERDLKLTATIEHNKQNIIGENEMNRTVKESLNNIELACLKATSAAGDTTTPNNLTMKFSNHTSSSNKNHKDITELQIDHLSETNELPKPSTSDGLTNNGQTRNKPPIPYYTKGNEKMCKPINTATSELDRNDNQLLLSINTSRSSTATDHKSSSISNLDPPEQLSQDFDYKKRLKTYSAREDIKNDLACLKESDVRIDTKISCKNGEKCDSKSYLRRSGDSKNDLIDETGSDSKSDCANNENKKLNSIDSTNKSSKPTSPAKIDESRLATLKKSHKNSKLKNSYKNNLNFVKSDLNDLNNLLETPQETTSSAPANNIKLMSFVVQPKSVNTDIDSRLMDHILAKICTQRDNDKSNRNIPSTSSADNHYQIGEQTGENLAEEQKTTKDRQESTNEAVRQRKQKMKHQPESKHSQTDKVQNQDASVCVNESDLRRQEADERHERQTPISGNDYNREQAIERIENDSSKLESDACPNKPCEGCKQRCNSTRQLKECSLHSGHQESLSHCCSMRSHGSCTPFLHHFHPVCLNTFNHNTFTSLPNLTQPLSRIEQGTNTEPNLDQLSAQSIKKDKQTQCILGLSIEDQQREYIEHQQQKYLKLKNEQKLKIQDGQSRQEDIPSPGDLSIPKIAKLMDVEIIGQKNADETPIEINKIEDRKRIKESIACDDKALSKSEMSDKKVKSRRQVDQSAESVVVKSPKRTERAESEENLEITQFSKPKKSSRDKISSDREFFRSSDEETSSKKQIPNEKKLNSSIPVDGSESNIESNAEKKLDITIPIKLPFEHQTSKKGRKLIDLSDEKNVKTHSKIIIEFSGPSKRERSAVDSFTKLKKDGRLIKKTLVSNTKEISVPTKEEQARKIYPLSSTPEQQQTIQQQKENLNNKQIAADQLQDPSVNQLITNENKLFLYRDQNREIPSSHHWKEASHSEISNEMQTDPLLDENKKAHPTRSITLSTITTFDQTARGQPQRIDHSNKYKRCFDNPLIHEPVIESNLTMLDESNQSNQEDLSSGNHSIQTSTENLNVDENSRVSEGLQEVAKDQTVEQMNLGTLLSSQQHQSAPTKAASEYRKSVLSSNESRSTESRMSENSSSDQSSKESESRNAEEQEMNLNSRCASRVSFNLPENYDRDEESSSSHTLADSQKPAASSYSLAESIESNLDRIEKNKIIEEMNSYDKSSKEIRSIPPHKPGLLETELDKNLFFDDERDDNDNDENEKKTSENQYGLEQENGQRIKQRSRKLSGSSKSKERKRKSSKRRQKLSEPQQAASDQSSLFSTTTQPRSTPKQFYDSGFLSPEIYHSSPYEMAYSQVNKDKVEMKEKKSSKEKKEITSSAEKKKSKSSKNLLKHDGGLQFTEHSSNTEIITRLTKTSYPSKYKEDDQSAVEKSLKNLRRNKMVLDQILNSPEIKSSSTKKSSRSEKKKKSGCKISSQITMDLPIYKDEKSLSKTAKSLSCPLKSLSLEELDKERDLDRKSIVSQHSYSQQSGEFNTMTKFQKYKPSSKSQKNKSAVQLNQPPDETNWEYTMQCNCVNGSKANVLTNVKHRRLLFFPLQQYETSL